MIISATQNYYFLTDENEDCNTETGYGNNNSFHCGGVLYTQGRIGNSLTPATYIEFSQRSFKGEKTLSLQKKLHGPPGKAKNHKYDTAWYCEA